MPPPKLNEQSLPDNIQELKELYAQLALSYKTQSDELKKLSNCLIQVREEERKHLANEVHEELGQLVAAVKMDIDWLRLKKPAQEKRFVTRIDHAAVTTELLMKNIRRIAAFLRPGMLDELGLNASLEWLCNEFTKENDIPCVFEQLTDDHSIGINVKTQFYRICEEALTNIRLHAVATHISVSIRYRKNKLELCITDDGKGFDIMETTGGIGLIIMRERAHSINGNLSIVSSLKTGTSISVIISGA